MSSSLQDQFEAAAQKARTVTVSSNATKQQIYALYKQATQGPLPSSQKRPSLLWDPTGCAKYDGWQALGDNMSKETAMQEYIQLIESLE